MYLIICPGCKHAYTNHPLNCTRCGTPIPPLPEKMAVIDAAYKKQSKEI